MTSRFPNKRWVQTHCDAQAVSRLARELHLSEILATLLANRGITDPQTAQHFLYPSLNHLHDPFLMQDMRAAVRRILEAIERKEKILIYGDYDVDGTTSTVILKKALTIIGADVSYYIPERLKDGYGLRDDAMEMAKAQGYHLVISVDTGIRARQVVEHARALGLDIIITDHHLPEPGLPRANAVLNPKREDCNYPNKNLAGCGVAFKLAQALFIETDRPQLVEPFIKIAAIGTIADIVPLTGENRVIAKFGLAGLSRPNNPGLRALLEVAGVAGRAVSCVDVGFRIGPRINAVGRMAGASAAVDLFDAPDLETAMKLAMQMNEQNLARQQAEADILAQVMEAIERDESVRQSRVAVIAGHGWHRGVIGIVASKVVEHLHRPAIIISIEGGIGHGSGRSIEAFHLLNGLESCGELFERFGGHAHAAGMAIAADRIDELRRRLNDYAATVLTDDALVPIVETDYTLPLKLASLETLAELSRLEPFGPGNPQPVFESHGAQIVQAPRVLKDKHLKFRVQQSSRWLDCLWWGAGHRAQDVFLGDRVSLAFTLSENTYNGNTQAQLILKDLKIE
ncbi:MAG TPA: single-stranded-DNA-specific exonuclease RecJ [Blastocatellia bacterium]|nr:single-stranded-DNA-specific exonuclease RecJ [Blastocatellia bacterium]